jgi:patatin-like phospholipase/acyl hydrolase
MFRILSVDGGGVRGIFPAHILNLFSKQHGSDIAEIFDLVIGTSTGAIIATAVATKIPLEKVVDLYETHAEEIFTRRWFSWRGRFRSQYESEPLRKVLTEVFEGLTMSAAKTRLLLPATDLTNGNVFVIKSPYLPSFVRDKDISLVDAVMASSAAPGYFDPVKVNEYLLADGGLWANNPSIVAYTEAIGKLGVPQQDVRILSIGTGTGHEYYDASHDKNVWWGLATGWGRTKLVDAIFNIQSRASSNTGTLLLRDQYLRLSFDATGALPLDDVGQLPTLKARAGEVFTYNSERIKAFLEL